MRLDDPVTQLKGIGPRRAETLGKLGLVSLRDLLYFAPRDYRDYSAVTNVCDVRQGLDAAFCVTVAGAPRHVRIRGLDILSAAASDATGSLQLTWYNQPYRRVEPGAVIACGRADVKRGRKLINPALYAALPGILPVYPLVQGLTQSVLRTAVQAAWEACGEELEETLPDCLRARYSLVSLREALQALHFPQSREALAAARRRLAFEDMLAYRLLGALLRARREQSRGFAFRPADQAAFYAGLPFAPTGAQRRANEEIAADMQRPVPMNRLLQGDVGSGKTLVALYAMETAVQNGLQAVLMAPTEILATQHYTALKARFGERACLLTGGLKKSARDALYAAIASGAVMAVVGTHALLQSGVHFKNLGLVVADEQHRFGVRQRAAILGEGTPDMLIMSATPIPRTLSLLLYGDLELSVLDELPPGRKSIFTRFVPAEKREGMYAFIVREVRAGRQAYVVCPLVEPSEAMEDALSVTALCAELRKALPVRVGLLHGQMKSADKQAAIAAFRAGETDVLVSTTVIEVGVDVGNATVMAIEGADRFGLAQLHQLRGRVGRGAQRSYCFLLSQSEAPGARERLSLLTQSADGFAIAQKDLALRGPGELLGARQHGLAGFGGMELAADVETLEEASRAATEILRDESLRAACAGLLARAESELRARQDIAMN